MIKSMTGFGRGTVETDKRSFIVEMRSVNHRYCDINIRMPKVYMTLEEKMRSCIKEKIHRGKVDVYITKNTYDKDDVELNFNESIADSYYGCLKQIKDKYDAKDDISVSLISRFQDVITSKQKEEDIGKVWEELQIPIKEAINSLCSMREREGIKLYENINMRCKSVKTSLDKIEKRFPLITSQFNDKIHERVSDLLKDSEIDEGRIAMEVALFVDKSSIDEEIVRLNSHIVQLTETLELGEPVGRKLDFIVQEMNREANTIASKTTDLETVNLVLNIKNDIEKIREQIQNIE